MKSLALFSGLEGVGRTTLTFNLAHLATRMGLRTVVLDCDPQCNLSRLFLWEQDLVDLWQRGGTSGLTVPSCLAPLLAGAGSIRRPEPQAIGDDLWLLPGHLDLARVEQFFSEQWVRTRSLEPGGAVEAVASVARLAEQAADSVDADLVLIDVGPNLGSLNRSAFHACDGMAFLLSPDLWALQDLGVVGPVIRGWRQGPEGLISSRGFQPLGYIVRERHDIDRPLVVYASWEEDVPTTFHRSVLGEEDFPDEPQAPDPFHLDSVLYFSSLFSLARRARKPVFDLKIADGIGSSQLPIVAKSRKELEGLVKTLAGRLGLSLPTERSVF